MKELCSIFRKINKFENRDASLFWKAKNTYGTPKPNLITDETFER